jgi:restriction system protein
MPIPDFQTIMLPFLSELSDGKEYKTRELIDRLAITFNLSEDELKTLLPSGTQSIFDNRVGWARTYLKKAGLVNNQKRSYISITANGLEVLNKKPQFISVKYLQQFPGFLEFQNSKKDTAIFANQVESAEVEILSNEKSPEEIIENSFQKIRKSLALDLLQLIKKCSPAFFEKLVVELLVKMGYGGSLKDAGEATKLTNDEGIDGIIKEDKLGLDVIYIQAKRWDNTSVGRPDIQSFVGALDGKHATKGIFITMSTFATTATEYVKTISKKVILIDGEQLAEYMIDYGLGVSTLRSFDLKRIDNDYFDE